LIGASRSSSRDDPGASSLSLPEELLLALLDEESGYFRQVPGWNLNCAMVGAVLGELSLLGRIDTDLKSLILVDSTDTGRPILDPILREIATETEQRNVRYWVERLVPQSESVINHALDRLVRRQILDHHPGGFYTFTKRQRSGGTSLEHLAGEFVKARLTRIIFADEIPEPREVIITGLVNACNVFNLMFQIDEEAEERIQFVSKMDVIGRAIAEAVTQSIVAPTLRRPSLTKRIPSVSLRDLVFNRELREGRLPAGFAILAEKYGPVFELRIPFRQNIIVLAGLKANQWANRMGRIFLRSKEYFEGVDKAYGVSRSMHSTDGADHFRFRKSLQPAYSQATLTRRLDDVFDLARTHMASWDVGSAMPVQTMLRPLLNAQSSPLLASIDTQAEIVDALEYKVRVLNVGIVKTMPRFMLKTPSMRRRAKATKRIIDRMQSTHTATQRVGKHKDVVDAYLALHASDPQFLPESDLSLPLGAILMTAMYMGDQIGFALYWLLKNPDLYERVTAEADALWAEGDPSEDDLTPDRIDVTRRVLMEALRMSPIVAMSMRTVMNTCVVEGYELPVGAQLVIAQTATHYSKESFPDPWTFDIDRYAPPRNEHRGGGYAPFGLGTHSCLGRRWAHLHMAINLLMLTHHFKVELARPFKRMPMDPLPSQSPSNKIRIRIAEQRHELRV
jgi:cytochrome P450